MSLSPPASCHHASCGHGHNGGAATVWMAALALLTLCVVVLPAALAWAELPRSALSIETASGRRYRFTVEVARTAPEMAQGLMYREKMADEAGMLFVYVHEQPATFWMKNTLIPLDILFLGGDGQIRHIHPQAKPLSLDSISSGVAVKAVLELNGGLAAKLGIRIGDHVVHEAFR